MATKAAETNLQRLSLKMTPKQIDVT